MAGLELGSVALARREGGLEGGLIHLEVLAQGRAVHGHELDDPPGRLEEALAAGLVEGLEGGVPWVGDGGGVHGQGGLLEGHLLVAEAVLLGDPGLIHGDEEGRLLDQLGPHQLGPDAPFLHGRVEPGLLEDLLQLGVGLQVALGVQQHGVLAEEGPEAGADLLVGHQHVVPVGQLLHELLVDEVPHGLGLDEGLEGLRAGLLAVALVELLHVVGQFPHEDLVSVDPGDHGIRGDRTPGGGQIGHQPQEDDDHDRRHGCAVGFEDLTEGTKHAGLQTDLPD